MATPAAPKPRVFGYTRVSVIRPGRDRSNGESLEVQRRKLEGWALQAGQAFTHICVERGVSGSRPLDERPQGKVLLAGLKSGDTVVASKLDRLFRSASDALRMLEEFKRRRVGLVVLDVGTDSIVGNGISALLFTVLSAVAQFERERIGERIRETKAHLRETGRYLGGARPFGYRVADGGTLELDPGEHRAIADMRRLRKRGKSLRVIRDTMKAKGFDLSHVAVRRILASR